MHHSVDLWSPVNNLHFTEPLRPGLSSLPGLPPAQKSLCEGRKNRGGVLPSPSTSPWNLLKPTSNRCNQHPSWVSLLCFLKVFLTVHFLFPFPFSFPWQTGLLQSHLFRFLSSYLRSPKPSCLPELSVWGLLTSQTLFSDIWASQPAPTQASWNSSPPPSCSYRISPNKSSFHPQCVPQLRSSVYTITSRPESHLQLALPASVCQIAASLLVVSVY